MSHTGSVYSEKVVRALQEENKKLKEEQLTEENAIQYVYENTDLYDDWVKGSTAYKELQEENKKLKKELDEENDRSIELIDEKKKLREENKKLKKEHIQNIMKTKSIATELYREVKYSLGYGEFDEPDRKVMYDDIKKLKEESKVDKQFQEEVVQENKKLEEENKKLKECVKRAQGDTSIFTATLYETKLKKDLLYYRFYAYTLDRSGDCDLTKEDVDYFTDDEAQRKTLYDRIGYEEDSDSDEEDSDSDEEEEEGVITDLNGKKMKVPSEEECLQKFGVSQGEFIALAKQSDCSQL